MSISYWGKNLDLAVRLLPMLVKIVHYIGQSKYKTEDTIGPRYLEQRSFK